MKIFSLTALLLLFGTVVICILPIDAAAKKCEFEKCAKCPDKEGKKEGCYCMISQPVFKHIWTQCRCLPCDTISTIPKLLIGCSLENQCQSVGDGLPQPPSEIYYGDAYPANVTL